MIEGKLIESRREPTNVQVVIEEDESVAKFVFMMDMSGVFMGPELILHPHKEDSGGSGAETHEEPENVKRQMKVVCDVLKRHWLIARPATSDWKLKGVI